MEPIPVLLVDDDALVLSALRRMLRSEPVQLQTAASAAEALALLDELIPAMVISDWHMPGMDGLALLAEIRRRHPSVHCVLHTAESVEITRTLAWPVLRKPCDLQQLRRLLDSLAQAKGRSDPGGPPPYLL